MSSNDDIFSPSYYEAIGRLVIACSELDSIFTDLIGVITQMHVIDAIIVVHHQQFASKHDTLLALLRGIDPSHEIEETMLASLNRARAIYDKRSRIVHSMWAAGETGAPMSVKFQARGRLKRSRQLLPELEIREAAREANEISAHLGRARDHFLANQNALGDRRQ